MRNDTNGAKDIQWFAFRMKNPATCVNTPIRIVICNFTKKKSLFQKGMKPSFWSLKANIKEERAWFNSGHNIKYEASQYREEINDLNTLGPKKNYMQLQFDFIF